MISDSWTPTSSGKGLFSRRRIVRGMLSGMGLVIGGGVLAACSAAAPQASSTTAASGAPSAAAPAQTAGTSAPKRGGTVRVVQVSDITPKSFHTNYFPNYTMMGQVTETLLDPDFKNKLTPVGILAESFEVSPDQLTFTFHLRKGVKFHSGTDLTADAVKANLLRVRDDKVASQYRDSSVAIQDIQTPDPLTLVAKVAQLQPGMIDDIFSKIAIVDPDTFDDAVAGKRIVGTGPFKWVSWTPNDRVVLARNETYWDPTQPLADQVEIRVVPDPQALAINLESGAVDLAVQPAYADIPRLRQNPGLQVVTSEAGSENFYLGADLLQPPLDDKRVRQALNWALDRKRIVDTALFGLGQAKSVPWGPANPAWFDDQANFYSLNVDKAKALLAEAGQSAGFDVTLSTNTGLEPMRAMAQVIQSDLANINVRVKINELEASRWLESLTGSKFRGLWLGPTGVGNFHPYQLLTSPFPFRVQSNASNFSSPRYAAMPEKLRVTDDAAFKAASRELTDILLDESFVMPYTIQKPPYAMVGKLQGFNLTFQGYPLLGRVQVG